MKFMLDEDVPAKLLRVLRAAGHDVTQAPRSTPDLSIARLAKTQERVLVSLDKDFTNTSLFPPSEFTIVHLQVRPPYADELIEAFRRLLDRLPADSFRGLIILEKSGSIRLLE